MVIEHRTCRLGDVADLRGGYAFKSKDYSDHGRFILRTVNITDDGRITKEGATYLPLDLCPEYERFALQPEDTLFVMVGATLGKVGYVREHDLPALLNQNMWVVRAKSEDINKRFLNYAFRDEARKILHWASGSARSFVRRDDFRNMEVPCPPRSEQDTIAHILGTLDDKVELNRRMNASLEAMARAIFKSWFVDFDPVHAKMEGRQPPGMSPEIAVLFPDSFEDSPLGKIPRGWKVKTIAEVLELAYGKALKEGDRRTGSVPVYGSNGQVGWHDEKLVDGPGIVVGRKGNPGFVTWSPTSFFPIDTTFYVVSKGAIRSKYYLFHALRLQDLPSLAADSAVPGVNRNMVYMNFILVPSSNCLELYDDHVRNFYTNIHANDEQSRTLANIRHALLPKLLSGEVRVKEAEKVVEKVT